MNNRKNTSALAAAALGIIAVVMILVIGPTTATATVVAPTAPSSEDGCLKYFAYDANGTGQFGADVDTSGTQVELLTRAIGLKTESEQCDPVASAAFVLFQEQGIGAKEADITALAQQFASDRSVWQAKVTEANALIDHYTVEDVQASYETMAMVVGADSSVAPRIAKFEHTRVLGWALVAHMKDGTERYFRIACRIQPSAPTLPGIPPTTTVTPPTTPPTVTPPTVTPPPCTTPEKPEDATHVYQLSSDGCTWVVVGDNLTDGAQSQSVQTDRGDQEEAQEQPAAVPSAEPASQPIQPLAVTDPPAPSVDGTNGGSTANPVPTGTPETAETGTHATPIPTSTGGAFG